MGWANGPDGGNGFGTHDWLFNRAWKALDGPDWIKYRMALRATDNPDTIFKDFEFHVYDRWGAKYGRAPKKVQELFDKTVPAYRAGDFETASRLLGRMSHYFSDVNNPLRTDASSAENLMRASYERAVSRETSSPDKKLYAFKFDGRDYVSDPAQFTRDVAVLAHADYKALVDEFNRNGMNDKVRAITKRRLNRAANGMADLIYSVRGKAEMGPTAAIETNKGRMVIELYPSKAPLTVKNFTDLADRHFYDGLTFHRYVPDFVIQGGDPKGDGTGGPGYTIPAEFNDVKHERGIVAMARSSDPDSAGSQFYIALNRDTTAQLDAQYTVFGNLSAASACYFKKSFEMFYRVLNDPRLLRVLQCRVTLSRVFIHA